MPASKKPGFWLIVAIDEGGGPGRRVGGHASAIILWVPPDDAKSSDEPWWDKPHWLEISFAPDREHVVGPPRTRAIEPAKGVISRWTEPQIDDFDIGYGIRIPPGRLGTLLRKLREQEIRERRGDLVWCPDTYNCTHFTLEIIRSVFPDFSVEKTLKPVDRALLDLGHYDAGDRLHGHLAPGDLRDACESFIRNRPEECRLVRRYQR